MKFEDTYKSNLKDKVSTYYDKPNVISQPSKVTYVEANPSKVNLNILQRNLENCLEIVDEEVMKGYVTKLEQLPIVEQKREVYSNLNDIHFFKISQLVYQEEEFSVDKFAMVFNTLSNKPCTLVLMLKSDGEKTDFYLGARPKGNNSAGTLFQMLKQSLLGFFPGSQVTEYYDEEMKKDISLLNVGCVSSVTSVADYKQQQDTMSNKDFIQGLEKFIYTMQGKSYTAIFIADNLSYEELKLRKREYEQIYTQLAPFANMQINFSVSDSSSSSKGTTDGKAGNKSYTKTTGVANNEVDTTGTTLGNSYTIGNSDTYSTTNTVNNSESDGRTRTKGFANTESETITKSVNAGFSKKLGFGGGDDEGGGIGGLFTVGASASQSTGQSYTQSVSSAISKTLTQGFSNAKGYSHSNSESRGINKGINKSKSTSYGTMENSSYMISEAFNFANTQSMTDTLGNSKGITLNSKNMTLNILMQKIEKHLHRLEKCESFGMWNFAAYFLGETAAETETAANTYKSIMAGEDSGIERNAINTWKDEASIQKLMPYIGNFLHPQFMYTGVGYDENRHVIVNPSALVSTSELAIHMGLPRHSVRGLPVVEHVAFGHEVVTQGNKDKDFIKLGNIFNMGQTTLTDVKLDIESLAMHTFITGSTGKGKSTVIYAILDKLIKHTVKGQNDSGEKIKFMVIEPAKGEYKDRFGNYPNVKVYGTNYKKMPLLKINPFSFPEDIHVLEHIDRLIEIFNVCWPMYAAMPAVLKEAIERAYIVSGWNLETSECRYYNSNNKPLFPCFIDVLQQIDDVMDKTAYSSDSKGDYKGALSTRLKSLTNGLYGQIFTNDELSGKELFDNNVIIDLSRTGSNETKSLIMALLVMKLQEYRVSNAENVNQPLKHITVLEEAHNILKRTSTEQAMDGANMVGKSVEMLANSIAEMRTYGEGFIIADQAPALMDMSVIRNTNTKIILGLPDLNDRELVGRAANLNDEQILELSRLKTFVAAVYQNNWLEPVLCNIETNFKPVTKYVYNCSKKEKLDVNRVLEAILFPTSKRNQLDDKYIDNVLDIAFKLPISSEAKIAFIQYINNKDIENINENEIIRLSETVIWSIFNSETVFALAKAKENNIKVWYKYVIEMLEPPINMLNQDVQKKIVIRLMQQRIEMDKGTESEELFARLISYL